MFGRLGDVKEGDLSKDQVVELGQKRQWGTLRAEWPRPSAPCRGRQGANQRHTPRKALRQESEGS